MLTQQTILDEKCPICKTHSKTEGIAELVYKYLYCSDCANKDDMDAETPKD